MRTTHTTTFLLLVVLAGWNLKATPSTSAAEQPNAKRPNVVFILTDDQRWDHLSCAGHPFLKTPHIDRLAAEGARFANAFVTTSLCSPSRASFLSGLYANTHGVTNNFTDYPNNLPSFPKRLKAAGYHTAYIGKWHMGEQDDSKRPGFDFWISHKGQGKYYDNQFNINGKRQTVHGYYTKVVTDFAVQWLKAGHNGRPFLLMLGHKAPHTPYVPEKKYAHLYDHVHIGYPPSAFHLEGKPKWVKERLDTWHGIYGPLYGFRKQFPDRSLPAIVDFYRFVQAYTATIKSIDDSVGRIYQTLKEMGELDNTLFIFTSDNGMFLGEHGMTDKRAMHEPSIRIPLVIRYPKLIRPGTVINQQVLNIDLAPTIIDICGARALPKVHGRSFVPLLKGRTTGWRTAWYYEYNYEKQFPYTPNVRGVRTDTWKYIRYPHGDGGPDRYKAELYNLKEDPNELHNLIDDPRYAAKAEELRRLLDKLIEDTGGLSYKKMPLDEGIKKELPDEKIR